MSPLFAELTRLARRYHDACQSPLSCPRDREILRTKLLDLEEASKTLRVRAAKAIELNEAERERLQFNLEQLRKLRAAAFNRTVQPVEPSDRDQSQVRKQVTSIKDLEELTIYVRFLSEVLNHFNTKQRKEPTP